MNKIAWDTEDGILKEADLWKLFTDHPDKASETVVLYHDIKPLLSKMKLEDDGRLYQVYSHDVCLPSSSEGASTCAIVTQRNVRSVAKLIEAGAGQRAAIQYLGLAVQQ